MADEIVGQTQSPTPEQTVTPTATPTPTPTEDGWNDSKFEAINTKYKSDAKEMAKALWNKDKEFTKMQQELQTLRSQSSKPQSDNGTNQSQSQNQSQFQSQSQSDPAQNASETKPLPTYIELNSKIYREVFESGKMSDETLQSLVEQGMPEADARIWAKANEYAIAETKKEAQSYVQTPLDELKKFAEAEGNYTDDELNQIQSSLNKGFYGVLKDVERKYKATQKVKVEHGDSPAGKVSTEGFASYKEWQEAKMKARTYQEIQEVEKRAMNSDVRNWHKQSIGY